MTDNLVYATFKLFSGLLDLLADVLVDLHPVPLAVARLGFVGLLRRHLPLGILVDLLLELLVGLRHPATDSRTLSAHDPGFQGFLDSELGLLDHRQPGALLLRLLFLRIVGLLLLIGLLEIEELRRVGGPLILHHHLRADGRDPSGTHWRDGRQVHRFSVRIE